MVLDSSPVVCDQDRRSVEAQPALIRDGELKALAASPWLA